MITCATYQKQTHSTVQWGKSQNSIFTLQPSIQHLRWVGKREGGRKEGIGKVSSSVAFGKITVLFMREGWVTTKNDLHSTVAFRVTGVYGRYWNIKENCFYVPEQLVLFCMFPSITIDRKQNKTTVILFLIILFPNSCITPIPCSPNVLGQH